MCLNDLTAETAQVAGRRGKGVTVVITLEKLERKKCALRKKRENLESQWSKRDAKPLSNWTGRKSKPVKAITAVKLKLSGTVSHSVHMLVLLEAFKGGANHLYLKIQPLHCPPQAQPPQPQHDLKKKKSRHSVCTLVPWLSRRVRKETAQVLFLNSALLAWFNTCWRWG